MVIYCIENLKTKQKYVGFCTKANTEDEFQKTGYWGSGLYISRAIQKHGKENFKKNVLIKNIFDFEELNRYEKIWIKKLSTKFPKGYNLTDGGSGCLNPSEEARKKRKEAFLKTISSFTDAKWEEIKEKISKGRTGISQKNRGRPLTEETRKKMSDSAKKRKASDETRRKMSDALKGRKKKNAHPMKGKKMSEEKKINYKKAQSNPEARKKQSERMKIWWQERRNKNVAPS